VRRPMLVVVLNDWVTDTKETSCLSNSSTSLAKSASERVSRSTLYGLGRHDEAIKNYDHVLYLQPSNPHAWFNRGRSLLELYEFEAARIAFIRRPGR
jgi:tetratricopeptide (TPR) repeat protein